MLYISLLDIPSFCSGEYWKGVCQNSIGCTIGSFVGVGTAIFLYVRNNKQTKQAEEVKNNKIQLERLEFFSTLINSVIATSTDEVTNLRKFVNEINANPFEIPLRKYQASFDLRRIVESNKIQDYLYAYIHKYPNKINAIENFKKLIDSCDYIFIQLKELVKQNEKAKQFETERKLKLINCFLECRNKILDLSTLHDVTAIAIRDEIFSILATFQSSITDKYDLSHLNFNFFKPLNHSLTTQFKNGLFSFPSLNQLIILSNDAVSLFEEILSKNLIVAEDINETIEEIDTQLQRMVLTKQDMIS